LRGVAAGEHIGVLKGVCLGVAIRFLFFEPESMIINNFNIIHLIHSIMKMCKQINDKFTYNKKEFKITTNISHVQVLHY